ncbi:HU family DNA-binding protein [Microbispora sp. ATCC PTA-5024]|uniref:HU family DNA-binding protein n=1 Tax=Microbispora sp. ATCC PTA-5024 TaxID=316330 RepID=UPI0003DCD75E|nr:HU family DNA-binding protein [Microbispora sp. ATCC PTA-5024]ETK36102.1 transcriptional regulator [Microbispora sp. ATCC PTA-5024]
MNKAQLIDAVAYTTGNRKTATDAVNAVLDAIKTAVASGDKVSITGFGAFDMVHKPARTAKKPGTDQIVPVAESWAPKFKPGSEFKAAVNEGGKATQAAA